MSRPRSLIQFRSIWLELIDLQKSFDSLLAYLMILKPQQIHRKVSLVAPLKRAKVSRCSFFSLDFPIDLPEFYWKIYWHFAGHKLRASIVRHSPTLGWKFIIQTSELDTSSQFVMQLPCHVSGEHPRAGDRKKRIENITKTFEIGNCFLRKQTSLRASKLFMLLLMPI